MTELSEHDFLDFENVDGFSHVDVDRILRDRLCVVDGLVLDPWVVVRLHSCIALMNVFHDQALQKVFRFLRMQCERRMFEMKLSFNHIADDLKL